MSSRQRLSLKGQALKYLSMREHSRVELRRKMLPHARLACKPADDSAVTDNDADADADADADMAAAADSALEDAGPCLDKLLTWLEDNGLLSEERFVESRVRTRSARFGTSRIRRELSQHGVELPLALRRDLEASEVERARQVWARRFDGARVSGVEQGGGHGNDAAHANDHNRDGGSGDDLDRDLDGKDVAVTAPTAEQRARQMRFLAARGFSSEAVRKVVWGSRDQPTSDDETAD